MSNDEKSAPEPSVEPDCVPAGNQADEAHLVGLVTRMGRRDEVALGELYDATVARLFALALRILGNAADAEEAVCDAFVQAWQHARTYRPARGAVLAWLITICRSRALDRRRRNAVDTAAWQRYADGESAPQLERAPDNLLEAVEERSLIHVALAHLDPTRRQVIGLVYLRGLSQEEIARHTGMPLGTVKSHIRRGLAELKHLLVDGNYER